MTVVLTPAELGAPERYTSWRHDQDRAYTAIANRQHGTDVLALPTGMGKSLVYMVDAIQRWLGSQVERNASDGAAGLTSSRTLVITSTRALQDQLWNDFGHQRLALNGGPDLTIVDVRGMANYPCRVLIDQGMPDGPDSMCDQGPCLDGVKCDLREGGCHYYDQVSLASKASIVITNYAFWFTLHGSGRSIGDFSAIVCDEAHEICDEVGRYLGVELRSSDCPAPESATDWPLSAWRAWAEAEAIQYTARARGAKGWFKRKLKKIADELRKLGGAGDDWIIDQAKWGWRFEPLWPRKYMDEWLWRGIPRRVLASATIRPKTLELIGLEPGSYRFLDFPSPIPAKQRPVMHIPTIRVRYTTTPSELEFWATRHDQVIGENLHHKGIIHTVSYDRAKYLVEHSEFAELMLVHDPRSTREVVRQFREEGAPRILVSPSMHTGWDFPYDQAGYQIISKVPYPDTQSAIMKARMEEDPDYGGFLAMVALVQAAGRIVRAPDDTGATYVLDDNLKWMVAKYKTMGFLPQWFLGALRWERGVPSAV